MKEDFLHYVWKFQKFETSQLVTTQKDPLAILSVGQHNFNSGPDFFNGRITINGQQWAGNIEIHIKSSDWYAHGHETDIAYDNVILHVVWEHDADIFRSDTTVIPTLVLKDIIYANAKHNYHTHFKTDYQFISCEQSIGIVSDFTIKNWIERLYFERLEKRSQEINRTLKQLNFDWEAVLFRMLAKGFGLKVNGESFLSIASSVEFSVIRKCSRSHTQLEALLLGQASLLETNKDDSYYYFLQREYQYLQQKFGITNGDVVSAKYFRLRPPNFPTLRLSQLATLYDSNQHLFSTIIQKNTLQEFYQLFDVKANNYWDDHFNFQVVSKKGEKRLTKQFINLLLINVILPVKFCYGSHLGNDVSEAIITLTSEIPPEENTIIKKFHSVKIHSENAMESQGLLELKNNYCNSLRCLHCAIGTTILKG